MANAKGNKEEMISVIGFTRLIGVKNPQQIYGMIQKGDKVFPRKLIEYVQIGERQQTFVKKDAALAWWNERQANNAAKRGVQVVGNADQVIERFVDMVEEAGKTSPEVAKLAAALKLIMKGEVK